MKGFGMYARLQLKRALRRLPGMLAVTLLLAALAALAVLLLGAGDDAESAPEPVRVGVVGDLEDGTIREGLQMLQSMDPSRFSLRLEAMDEAEAARALRRGRIEGYLVVPEGFAQRWMQGEHPQLVYVTAGDGGSLGAKLVRELAETLAGLVLETENAVYGAQDFTAQYLPALDPYAAGDRLVLRYALRVIDRERLYELALDPARTKALSLAGSAFCALSLLFVMLWPVSCAPLFSRRGDELHRVLAARSLRGGGQVLAEFLGYLLLLTVALLAAAALGALLLRRFGLVIPELAGLPAAGRFLLLWRAAPVVLMLCAQSFLLYELAQGPAAGILLQFFNALLQGYLGGCVYPASLFPERLQRLGALLPAGAALKRLQALLLDPAAQGAASVWALAALLLLAAAAVREARCRA